MSPDDPRHGSYAGAQRHRHEGERPCGPCLVAAKEYMRAYRQDPAKYAKEKAGTRAASRALWRLADLHRDTFDALYAQELAAEHVRRPTQ